MKRAKNIQEYDEIIHLPHHVSPTRARMSNYERAAQFSPFAALTGHEAAVKETARLTDRKLELDEYEKSRINEKLQRIAKRLPSEMMVTITYFQPDEQKSGGAYVVCDGCVKKLDEYAHAIVMADKTRIKIEQIVEIDCELFRDMEL